MRSFQRSFQSCRRCFSGTSDPMERQFVYTPGASKRFIKPLKTPQYGVDVLHDSLWNKGTAFNYHERDALGLRGLLPPAERTLEEQLRRTKKQLDLEPDAIAKNLALQDLQNRNETLFYRLLVDHLEEVAPLVYTPTVGDVCLRFGVQYRRARGMYFSKYDRGFMSSMVHNWPHDDVHVIVVTDGSRILGLGDLGVNGMGIPIGKASLYVAAGGIAPHRVLPVCLDVGTNNKALLSDEEYLGVREPRLVGDEYFSVVDEFMAAVFHRWPNVIVQFEDFESEKAIPLLARYRTVYRMFNDDIQGTGAVTLAGMLSAVKIAGLKLSQVRVLCAGAGSAGLGVCGQLMEGMVNEGTSPEAARSNFALCTINGVIGAPDGRFKDPNHTPKLNSTHVPWVNNGISDGTPLLEAIKQFKPNVLLGLSTASGLFNEEVIRTMQAQIPGVRPIIMPMSNPTSRAECTPEQAYQWTNNQAIVATGSPFSPVTLSDGRKLIPSQCNNMYVFPGLGLAASVSGVTHITDRMLYLAADAISKTLTESDIEEGRTFPPIQRIREVSSKVALAVIEEALREDTTTKLTKLQLRYGLEKLLSRKMYWPVYAPLIPSSLRK